MMSFKIISGEDESKVRDIDREEKNKFKFDWLSKTVKLEQDGRSTDVSFRETIKKIDISGKAVCTLCNDVIYYGKRGCVAISDHLKTKKHKGKVFLKKENYALPSSFSGVSADESTSRNVPVCDRINNAEALVLGVLAEHSLPFSMAEVIVNVSKELSADKKALNHLVMKRASASYKMKFGIAKTFLQATIENLKSTKFSLNIDEATSVNNMRVLTLLCSYFSSSASKVVVEHLTSISLTKVSAENLLLEISNFFSENEVPWESLISVLMDSCRVMRGSKAGFETKIRSEKAPHLLDVDGDSCHHIHNASKRFSKPFNMWLENLIKDICNDVKWSVDIKTYLAEVSNILGVRYVSPVMFITHRWMSCHDAALNFVYLLEAFTVIYFSFLSNEDKISYYAILCTIYQTKNVSASDRAKIKEIQNQLSSKKLTNDGAKRKERICIKLFADRKSTKLIAHFYISVLPLLKKYVLLFQTKEPLIHKIFDEQKQLLLDLLACFIAPEHLQIKTVKELCEIDISDENIHLAKQKMFIGSQTQIIMSNRPCEKAAENFLTCAKQAYIDCAIYLQKTLPLNNKFLKCASAIDPTARGHQITCQRLEQLPSLLCNVLSLEEKEKYSHEIFQYQVDISLPSPVDDQGNLVRVDSWWAKIFLMPKYFTLSKIVKAVLSCFHGPQVESSFSMMQDIIDKRSGKMEIETYSAIQTVKYKLLAEKKSAVQYFHRQDIHQPVDAKLCKNLRSSRMSYQAELEKKKKLKENKKIGSLPPMKTKVAEMTSLENASRFKHKRKLEILAKKVQNKKIKPLPPMKTKVAEMTSLENGSRFKHKRTLVSCNVF